MALKLFNALAFVLLLGDAKAFTSHSATNQRQQSHELSMTNQNSDRATSRRDFGSIFLSSSVAVMVGSSLPAFADVSEGNALPKEAAQFSRIVRAKTDLQAIKKRVQEGASEMDRTEWDNVGAFLRRVYAVSEDMKAVASGFYDSDKKKRSSELIDELRKFSKAADGPTAKQSGDEFLPFAKKLISILDEFLDLLSDVPDEI